MKSHPASLLLILCAALANCAELLLPSDSLERDREITAIFRTNPQATGKGTLSIHWTDSYGRLVEQRSIPVELVDETEVRFPLDLRRAVAMENEIALRFDFEGVDQSGKADKRSENVRSSFIARPPDRRWWDYQIVMWQQHNADVFRALKPLGISGGQYSGRATTPPQFLLSNNLRWYAENIATDFYAEYHRFRRDRKQNWSFLEAKKLFRKDPASKEAFKRHPSLSDPAWLEKVKQRLIESARFHSRYRPLFYSLADESGIADLAAYWDFDFSDHSLSAMREWLRNRYTTLAALNAQWGTSFASWNLVIPDTTNHAMKRTDNNFSSWSDHKEWMDVAFARALKMGADAINSVDRDAYVSIGGAQMPGWGGYDYGRLTQALSALEPYNIGNNVEIIRSLNPATVMMTTAFARGPWEKHRVWYELLHGSRGIILWDEKSEFISRSDGSVGERGQESRTYFNELRSGVAALLINSVRQNDPVAIHYSQASMRIEWMLAQKPGGEAWVDRSSATERRDSEFLRLRESWCRLIEDVGLQYNFVASHQVEAGELTRRGYRVLILPRSTALSFGEAEEIRRFVSLGGTVITDGEPGRFDEHSRQLAEPALQQLVQSGTVTQVSFNTLDYHQHRLVGKEAAAHQATLQLMRNAAVSPQFEVIDADGRFPVGIEVHQFRNGGVTLLALHSNPQLRVDELGPPEFKSNERFERLTNVTLKLPLEMNVHEVRSGKARGRTKSLKLVVDPYEPTLLALSAAPLPELEVAAPRAAKRGETLALSLRLAGRTTADTHVFHVRCTGPDGASVPHYGGNVLARQGIAGHSIPFAVSDPAGRWTVAVTDVLSGQQRVVSINVE